MNYLRYYVLVTVALVQVSIYCQNINYTSYTTDDGLSQNSVYAILETEEGFIWLGTQDGLNRFDGKNFKLIKPCIIQNSKTTCFSKHIVSLYADYNDHIWVGTTVGLLLYDRYTEQFLKPEGIYSNFNLPKDIWIKKIVQDKYHSLWFLSNEGELYQYDVIKKSTKKLLLKQTNDLKINDVTLNQDSTILLAAQNYIYISIGNKFEPSHLTKINGEILTLTSIKNEIWLVNNEGEVYVYNLVDKKINTFNERLERPNPLVDARLIFSSSERYVWIGSRSSGFIRVDLISNSYQKGQANGAKDQVNSNFILSFFNTNKRTIIGQSGGGFTIHNELFAGIKSYININQTNNQLYDNMIFSLFLLNDKEMYAGTLTGGLMYKNLETDAFRYFSPPIKDKIRPDSKNIYNILRIGDDLWMASWGGLLKFNLNNKTFVLYTNSQNEQTIQLTYILKLRNHNKILLGGYNGKLLLFNLDTNTFEPIYDRNEYLKTVNLRVRYMKEEADGIIYISSEANSICKYDLNKGIFTAYPKIKSFSATSRHFVFNNGNCYIATDNGLIISDSASLDIKRILTQKSGLPNEVIYAVQIDDQERIWLSSNQGISMLDKSYNIMLNMKDKNVLHSIEFNTASFEKDIKGNLFFGSTFGFLKINPNLLFLPKSKKAPVITDIKIMNSSLKLNKDFPYIDTLMTTYNKNFITIDYQSTEVNLVNNASYRYKMEGLEDDWVNTGSRNYVSYSNLGHGTYTFFVSSNNIDNTWSTPKKLVVIVKPAWYQLLFFKVLFSLIVLIVFYLIFRWRLHQMNKSAFLEKDFQIKLRRLEMDNLRSQMNPHFLFNALNSINKFIIENNTKLASDYLTKFSKLMRLILENSKQRLIKLENELEALRLYLLIESNRFDHSFEYTITVEEDLDTTLILLPPLIIQPFVENAIWHGLAHQTKKGKIDIVIKMVDTDKLLIKIMDNGVGRIKASQLKSKSGSNQKSYGMDITYERITNVTAENTLEIVDQYDNNGKANGTCVNLMININN